MTTLVFLLHLAQLPPQAVPHTAAYFEPNQGQFAAGVRFAVRGARYQAWISDSELVVAIPGKEPVRIQFGPESRKKPLQAEGIEPQPGLSNYYLGSDSKKWITGVPAFSRARLHEVYPGVDVEFYEKDRQVEYDLIVKPGADASQISLRFEAGRWKQTGRELVCDLGQGRKLRHQVPAVHQEGEAVAYATRFDGTALRFEIAEHDPARILTIDPTLVYGSFVGGSQSLTNAKGIAVDTNGAMYVTGMMVLGTNSMTGGTGTGDVYFTKIGPTPVNGVHPRLFTSYYGGSKDEEPQDLVLHPQTAVVWIGGFTRSANFPVPGGFQTVYQGGSVPNGDDLDGFVLQANANTGALQFGTFVGGSSRDEVRALALDAAGNLYLGGQTTSPNLLTRNATQPAISGFRDAFVCKLSGSGSAPALVYATYIGAFGDDSLEDVAVTKNGEAVLTGSTYSATIPEGAPAQGDCGFGTNPCAYVVRISSGPTGAGGTYPVIHTLVYGRGSGAAVAVDGAGDIYVAGSIRPLALPPVRAVRNVNVAPGAAHILKISGTLTGSNAEILLNSPLPGGNPSSIAVDLSGAAYIAGDLVGPYTVDDIGSDTGTSRPYVTKLSTLPTGPGETYAVLYHLGIPELFAYVFPKIAVDGLGQVYLALSTYNLTSPVVNGTAPPAGIQADGYLAKLSAGRSTVGTVSVWAADLRVPFTTSGIGCTPGRHTTPKIFDWPVGSRCTIEMPFDIPLEADASRYQFKRWQDSSTERTTRVIDVRAQPQAFAADYGLFFRVTTGTEGMEPVMDGYVEYGTELQFHAKPKNPSTVVWTGFGGWKTEPDAINTDSLTLSLTVTRRWKVEAIFGFEFKGTIPPPLQFVPVTPVRAFDSRLYGRGESLRRNQKINVAIPNVEPGAVAVSINVTVIPRSGSLGYLAVWPGSGSAYYFTSLLNALDGRIKANSAIVPLGSYRSLNFFTTDATDVIVDVNGYFLPPRTGSLQFYPVTPCRITDTRLAASSLNGPALVAKQGRTIPIRTSPCGIPATAQAYSLNATVVPSGPLGYLTLWPTGSTQPVVSTLNALTGTVVANSAIVPAGTNGSVDVYATDAAHLVLDINGYFAPPGQPGGLNYHVMPGCRAVDTRNPNGPTGGPIFGGQSKRDYGIPNTDCVPPAAARAYVVNATVVPPLNQAFGFLTLWPSGAVMPLASTLNAVDGAITSNGAIVPANNTGSIAVYASDPTHVLLDFFGYFLPPQ